jgi:hypothetical protein
MDTKMLNFLSPTRGRGCPAGAGEGALGTQKHPLPQVGEGINADVSTPHEPLWERGWVRGYFCSAPVTPT